MPWSHHLISFISCIEMILLVYMSPCILPPLPKIKLLARQVLSCLLLNSQQPVQCLVDAQGVNVYRNCSSRKYTSRSLFVIGHLKSFALFSPFTWLIFPFFFILYFFLFFFGDTPAQNSFYGCRCFCLVHSWCLEGSPSWFLSDIGYLDSVTTV